MRGQVPVEVLGIQKPETGDACSSHTPCSVSYPALFWPACAGVACDLKSLSSHAGGRPDPVTYVLLHRKHLQVLLRAGSVATSHCWFCTAPGSVTTEASLGADRE